MSELLIDCRGLGKVFESAAEELTVLRGIDLEVEAGKTVSITGASGSGKSTLLSILGGLDRASSGFLRVGDYEVSKLSEHRLTEYRGALVGFVFQFHYLLKDFTALENVALPAYMRGEKKREAFERAGALLSDVGLGDRLDHYPSELSGGERQRAAIARALINRPALVLADEPTGNLDAASAAGVTELLFGLPARYGSTAIVVTHDARFAAQAERRYALRDGLLEEVCE
jgi:lipoprotein-releasing system ATP-binding protein